MNILIKKSLKNLTNDETLYYNNNPKRKDNQGFLFETFLLSKKNKNQGFLYETKYSKCEKVFTIYIDNLIKPSNYTKNHKKNTEKSINEKFVTNNEKTVLTILQSNVKNSHNLFVVFDSAYKTSFSQLYPVLLDYKGHLLYFSDNVKNYYHDEIFETKSKKINSLEYAILYIHDYIRENNINSSNIIFYGDSMGAYAAVYCSIFFKNSYCFALSLQTMDVLNNDKIIFINKKDNYYKKKVQIQSIPELLKKNKYSTNIYLINCETDCKDEMRYFDLLQVGQLLNYKNVKLIIVDCKFHSIFSEYKVYKFIQFINNLSNTLIKNKISEKDLIKNLLTHLEKFK
jgi:hypothetical protein